MDLKTLDAFKSMLTDTSDDKVTIDKQILLDILDTTISLGEEVEKDQIPKTDNIFKSSASFDDDVVDGVRYVGIGKLINEYEHIPEIKISTIELVALYKENLARAKKNEILENKITGLVNRMNIVNQSKIRTYTSKENANILEYKVLMK